MNDYLSTAIWATVSAGIAVSLGGFSEGGIFVLTIITFVFNLGIVGILALNLKRISQGKTSKCEELWKKMKADVLLWSRRQDAIATTVVLAGCIFYGDSVLSAVAAYLAIFSGYKYLSHITSNYSDDFQSPDGFV